MTAFYNEHDHEAAEWLRSLIAAGQIAPGIVDERSIEDVRPDELAGFTQCHFFAGVGIWSLALRAAGVSDDTPVWTGSCPCQPFSSAGKGAGFDDERHVWPAWQYLISVCRPPIIFGEQVAAKAVEPWIDLVHADLEALGYAFGCVPFPSAGVGAPHIRDRAYWVADTQHNGCDRQAWIAAVAGCDQSNERLPNRDCSFGELADLHSERCEGKQICIQPRQPRKDHIEVTGDCGLGRMADTNSELRDGCGQCGPGRRAEHSIGGCACGLADAKLQQRQGGQTSADDSVGRIKESAATTRFFGDSRPGPVNGFWRAADWLHCRDGKWRPAQPGTSALAYGMPRSVGAMSPELRGLAELAGLSGASLKAAKAYRTGSLKGYGNAINAKAAQAFIECVMEAA